MYGTFASILVRFVTIARTSEKEQKLCLQAKLCSISLLKILPVTSAATKLGYSTA